MWTITWSTFSIWHRNEQFWWFVSSIYRVPTIDINAYAEFGLPFTWHNCGVLGFHIPPQSFPRVQIRCLHRRCFQIFSARFVNLYYIAQVQNSPTSHAHATHVSPKFLKCNTTDCTRVSYNAWLASRISPRAQGEGQDCWTLDRFSWR